MLDAPEMRVEPIVDKQSKIWDRFADGYAKKPIDDEAAYQHKLDVTRKLLRPDMEVLEFGCGTGGTAILHAPFVNHIHAIDISAKMLEFANTKLVESKITNVTFERAGIDKFEVPDQTYDVILGLSILHLLADKETVMAKVHKMLKPGGLFIISTVCAGDTQKYLKLIASVGNFFGFLPSIKVFSTNELVKSITDTGFDIDYQWSAGKGKSAFIVAKKAE